MKKMIFLLCIGLLYNVLQAQQISRAEYFWDTDPGFGNGTSLPVSEATDIELNFVAEMEGLTPGLHFLYIRARDIEGRWSHTLHRLVWVERFPESLQETIERVEFFIDNDPGPGLSTAFDHDVQSLVEIDVLLDIDTLSPGFHQFFVRARDSSGSWSSSLRETFWITKSPFNVGPVLSQLEYFVDIDPGVGQGISLPLSPQAISTLSTVLPVESLQPGMHRLYLRARDVVGGWGHTLSYPFYLAFLAFDDLASIVHMEYFFDEDPGIGQGIPLSVDEAPASTVVADLSLDTLSRGFHTLFVRACDANGLWGTTLFRQFVVMPMPHDSLKVVRLEYFIDEDPGVGNATPVFLLKPDKQVRKFFIANLDAVGIGTHGFYVRALDDKGYWSLVFHQNFEMLPDPPCEAPASLNATEVTQTTAMLQWVSDQSPWDILLGGAGFELSEEGELLTAVEENPQLIQALQTSTLYDFYVRSTCSDGQFSPWAGPAQFHTLPLPTYELILLATPEDGGVVSGAGFYIYGEEVTISATAAEGFRFAGWTGATAYVDYPEHSSCIVAMPAQSITLLAHFEDATQASQSLHTTFSLYPNPASDQIWILTGNDAMPPQSIGVYNLTGQLIDRLEYSSEGHSTLMLSVSHLESGIYFLVVQNKQTSQLLKVIISR